MKQVYFTKAMLVASSIVVLTACGSDGNGSSNSSSTTTTTTQVSSAKTFGIFAVQNDNTTVVMNGDITSSTLADFNKMIAKYPSIKLINMNVVPGSTDDEINLQIAKKVHELGIATHLMANGEISSGGVDFFLAGTSRSKGDNSKIGVHSWSDGVNQASAYPKGHANHVPYINFYTAIGMTQQQAEDFYYFTINSASADSIHWMTKAEVAKYNILTSGSTITVSNNGIETTLPSGLGSVYSTANKFNRYTKVTAPNGKPIHIVAQDQLTDEQIIRARSVLAFYLTNYEGSLYGSDKSAVANKMADNGAILALLNGADGENPVGNQVTGQPLYYSEIQTEGGSWYMNQNYEHRDATFEEILHFVHDNGIGVDGNSSFMGVLPAYQSAIRTAQQNALSNNLWGMGQTSWIKELTQENSLSQEYLASVIDSYYGLWGAYKESSTNGMWGFYVGKDRADQQKDDPMGYALVGQFFHPYLTYNARIDASLNGNFSLKYDASKPYTNHSRYLKDITLLGTNNNSVTVNELDNDITGNDGSNTVIFTGKQSDYRINSSKVNGTQQTLATVTDKVANRDGKNTLKNVQKLQFSDGFVTL